MVFESAGVEAPDFSPGSGFFRTRENRGFYTTRTLAEVRHEAVIKDWSKYLRSSTFPEYTNKQANEQRITSRQKNYDEASRSSLHIHSCADIKQVFGDF